METNLTNPTCSYRAAKQKKKMIKIWQDVTRVKNFGTKVPTRHYIKDEAKSRMLLFSL
jgi:hypothetical protein